MSVKDAQNFEKGRIKALQEERVYIQKKTFTKWANSFLEKARLEIKDLFTDLADGKILMKLLEIISGENLGKPNKGVLRVQKVENLNKCLKFLATKVYFENIGAEDILDGNPRLILGLIWTIILRFQIQEITVQVDEDEENSEKRSAKDALLLWCQRKTAGYPNVNITNFTTSWRNGLGFNALIHAHRPDLIEFERLEPVNHVGNLNNAFNVAKDHLGIPKILDAEDVDVDKPDEKVVLTYVASYYHYFAKMKSEMTGGKRIAKIVGQILDVEKMEDDYETLTTALLEWIRQKIGQLQDKNFPNSLEGIQQELLKFKEYMTAEKPPKYRERGNIEAQYFSIQAKLKANGQKQYVPPEGKLIHDIETAWKQLENAEHQREVALREELIRQEKLEQLARKFARKAGIREAWLGDMEQILEEKIQCNNAAQTEAAVKKHHAISAEILARKDRFSALSNLAKELVQGNYHAKTAIKKKDQEIVARWQKLLDKLESRRNTLSGFNNLMGMFREIESIQDELKEVDAKLKVGDTGKHLQATEDLLQQHALLESQLQALAKRARKLNRRSTQFADEGHPEAQYLNNRLEQLNELMDRLQRESDKRRKALETAKAYYQFLQDSEEEEQWVNERIAQCRSATTGKDLTAALGLLKKHEDDVVTAMEAEMAGRWPRCEQVCSVGQDLVNSGHEARSEIGARIKSLMDKWKQLQELAQARRIKLDDAIEAQQYYADANEAESWMREKMPLVCSDDYGKDEASAQALLSRHNRLDKDIKSFSLEIKRLEELALLMTKAASEHNISPEKFMPTENGEASDEDEVDEVVNVPQEVEVEEVVQKEVLRDEVETRKIPQVKMMYNFTGQDLKASKGEIMILMQKTNNDWWQVRLANGTEGFVPANYVKETEPKVVQRVVQKMVKVPERVKVKKTVMKKEVVKKKKSSRLRRAPSCRSKGNLHFDKDNVESRQKAINLLYNKLVKLSQARKVGLDDAINLFKFYRECDEFEAWMIEKEQLLKGKERLADNMEAVRKKFENLLTSLAANKGRLDAINHLADDIVKSGSSQQKQVQQRRKEINDRWDYLNKLKHDKEKTLEGASSIELFKSTCDELQEWIKEKKNALASDDITNDLKGIQAQQRRHANLERELVPMEEKMNRMKYLADSVKSSYPDEAGYVDQRQKELLQMWKDLQDGAEGRKDQLGGAQDRQQFAEEAKELMTWASATRAKLASAEMPHDTQSAEQMLKEHDELKDDIKVHEDKFRSLKALGRKILAKEPGAQDVQDKLRRLEDEERNINDLWLQRQKQLEDAHHLQVFNRDADHIDAVTSSHEAFLEFSDLGSTVDDVKGLLKRHDEFESKLQAQDEKIKGLDDLANVLISGKHPDSKHIDARRQQVLDRRQKVKDKAAARRDALLQAKAFQEFRRDGQELSDWIKDKKKTAADDSYKDLSNLPAKLQKHQAFEAELKANNDGLQQWNKLGKNLVDDGHYAGPEIQDIMQKQNHEWTELNNMALERGQKLREASQQHTLNKALEDAQAKLDAMEKSVANPDLGSDLRSVKKLLKDHQNLETDLASLADTIQGIVSSGKEMADAGHFNKAGILKAVEGFQRRFERLKPAVANRKQQLNESLQWHQFTFDADSELQWIKEYLPAAASTDYGKNLVDAQKYHKKHQELERELQGHYPNVEKVLAQGEALLEQKHFASKPIKDKCQELQLSWDDLMKKAKMRKKQLDINLQIQKYLSEVAEIEAWIAEKMVLVSSKDYGKDENAADKLLAKNKVLETDIQTYQGIVNSLGKESSRLFKLGCADPTQLKKAQDSLQENFGKLRRQAAERSRNLERTKRYHSYMRESEDFEDWINEQMQTATSEEYGEDFEHLQILQEKFEEFKRSVEAGSERFNRCERMAKWFQEEKGPYSHEVEERQDQLRETWNTLLEQIDNRDHKMQGAEEIHRYNRDVEEALSRIQEKSSSIPDDLGRDYNSTLTYLKKHEAFENELVALEAQLQVLMDDSYRLQQAYPGDNAEQISQLQAAVVDSWAQLQEQTEERKAKLNAAAILHKYNAAVRDLLDWARATEREMLAEQSVRDVYGALRLRERHDEIRAEIEARQDTFDDIILTGMKLVEEKHYAADEIREKVQQVQHVREKLLKTWEDRKNYFDQLYDLHMFLRDADLLNSISTSQETYLSSPDYADSVSQMEALIRKHDAFDKVLAAQDEKLQSLSEHGQQLVAEEHFQAQDVKKTMTAVTDRRDQIKKKSGVRKSRLEDSLLYTKFCQDMVEAEGWIDDKLKVTQEDNFQDATDLHDKMRKLQKHQAFEAEIVANTDRINKITETGELLIRKKHAAQGEIQQSVARLGRKWKELLQSSSNRGRGLEEAKDILLFSEQVDKVEMWIRDKEDLVNAGDTGKDYEHCLELMKKVNNQESGGITVDEKRIKAINDLADRLISQGHTDTRIVKEKRTNMNQKWRSLQGALAAYKDKLAAALEIHSFNRDVDDINDRIHEKATLLSVDDLGRDLDAVQALLRKQEEIERDMSALQNQLEKTESQAGKLCHKYPDMRDSIEQKNQEAEDNWERLEELSDTRKSKLAESYQLQKFLFDARELIQWSNEMVTRMNSADLAKDVMEAENLLQMHNERKAEIDGRKSHFLTLREQGTNLVNAKHYAAEEVQKTLAQLETTRLALNGSWDKRNRLLTQCHNLQVFKETADQADAWLATKEAFLANEDLGNTLYSVESLLKKHDGFEKTVKAQEDRIEELKLFASNLNEEQHYAVKEINTRCQAVLNRCNKMHETSNNRRRKLEDSRNYQLFLRNLYEVSGWINEKLQVALDESYRDPTNLQAKLQKHQAFEAELAANRNRVDAVVAEGQGLIEDEHYATADIRRRLEELELSWQALIAASAEKKDKLQDAHQALMFNRVVEDLQGWMDEVENQLSSEDHGHDLVSVNSLLKKQQQLEADISNHQEKVQEVLDAAQVFKESRHFLNKELQSRAKEVSTRYNSLAEPCHIRRENLEEALRMYQFFRDVEDEMSWIQEKRPLAESSDLGQSLGAVQNLMKKHQALESEIVAHEPLIEAVSSAAQKMIRSQHFASQEIQERLAQLHQQLQELKQLSSARKLRLQASLEAQKFYTEVAEVESWMREKIPILKSPDLGKDETSTLALMKKLDALERDIDNYSNSIGELSALSRTLIEKGHYDSENIKRKQTEIETMYSSLQDLTTQRRTKLNDNKWLFEFLYEADEVSNWIADRGVIAGSEDYGLDLEHVEVLQQKFEDFMHDLENNEERVTKVTTMAQAMLDKQHFEADKVRRRQAEIRQLWADLREVAQARQEALANAKEVHMYGRDADDTLEWIQEKDGVVSSDDYGHDLESVQALLARHEGLERDLAAISEQVETITKEAERLLGTFPDAQEHIAAKHEEMVQAWNALVEKATQRKQKLAQAEQLQMYFNDYRELTAWISEMMAIITADELAHDLPGAEAMVARYKEHKAEVDARQEAFSKFRQTGQGLIANRHFLSTEIQEKITQLDESLEGLIRTLDHRGSLHEQNLEAQQLKHEMDQVDAWMSLREPMLKEKNDGNSIKMVEDLLRRHQDFQQTVDAMEGKINALRRKTNVEKAFAEHRLLEQQQVADLEARREKDRLDDLRRREQERILEERRREEENRKAREVLLRRQREGEGESDEEEQRQLNKSTVSNLIGRSQSIKMNARPEGSGKDVRRAMSFRQGSGDQPTSPVTLQKAAEFKQGEPASVSIDEEHEHADTHSHTSHEGEEGEAPQLPNAPPPAALAQSPDYHVSPRSQPLPPASPTYGKKEALSPPLSPKQKHLEHVKEEKKSKRTPSFNLRRKTRSFKDKFKLPENLPPVEVQGHLDRKQELQSGGKKAAIRSWKSFYTALFGQLLCFFKDKESFMEMQAAAQPLNIHQAVVEAAADYTKKKNVMRLRLQDGAEFLLEADSAEEMSVWIEKILHFAELPAMASAVELCNSGQLLEGEEAQDPSDQSHQDCYSGRESPREQSPSPERGRTEVEASRMEALPEVRHSGDYTDSKPRPGSSHDEDHSYSTTGPGASGDAHDANEHNDEDDDGGYQGRPAAEASVQRHASDLGEDGKHEKEKRKGHGVFGFLKKKKEKEHKKEKL